MQKEIESLIPQRPPFLFVDQMIERGEKTITTALSLTGDEAFFQGHFPGLPVMPGVLMQEALFQTAALLMASQTTDPDKIGVVTKVSLARFRQVVRPPVQLTMQVEEVEALENAVYFKGKTMVAGKTVAQVEFTCALVPKDTL